MAQRGSRNDHRARRGAGRRGNKRRKLARRIAGNYRILRRQETDDAMSLSRVGVILRAIYAAEIGQDDFGIFDQSIEKDQDFF